MVQGACQPIQGTSAASQTLLAPFWHTRALIFLLLAVALAGVTLDPQLTSPAAASRFTSSYLPLLIVNSSLVLYASGFGLQRPLFRELLGELQPAHLTRQLAWSAGLVALVLLAEAALQFWLGMPESLWAHALLPRGPGEVTGWIVLSTIIGWSEELVYRGYLRRQLAALSGSAALGVLLQGLLFGVAHGQQGQWAVARFAFYGVAFGYVAARERSILPCVLCHVGLDVYAGAVG
jgi:membrane protease YdiL (CAAX protease family)